MFPKRVWRHAIYAGLVLVLLVSFYLLSRSAHCSGIFLCSVTQCAQRKQYSSLNASQDRQNGSLSCRNCETSVPLSSSRKSGGVIEKHFYLVTVEDFEAQFPEVRPCGYTIHGAMSYERWLHHPARISESQHASIVIFPPFLVDELNWPVYGGGVWENNFARPGENPGSHGRPGDEKKIGDCSRRFERLIRNEYIFEKHQHYLLHFGSSGFDRGYELDSAAYVDERAIVAKGEALIGRHRAGWDISLPPPFTDQPLRFRHIPTSTGANRSILIGFKGDMGTHDLRSKIRDKLHDPSRQIFVLSKDDDTFEYWELLSRSIFALVMRGHVAFSYRFSEVVCSGAIPILISDEWVPPFEDLVSFDQYGVRVTEGSISNIYDIVMGISLERRKQLAEQSSRFCHEYMITPWHQFDAMIKIALTRV